MYKCFVFKYTQCGRSQWPSSKMRVRGLSHLRIHLGQSKKKQGARKRSEKRGKEEQNKVEMRVEILPSFCRDPAVSASCKKPSGSNSDTCVALDFCCWSFAVLLLSSRLLFSPSSSPFQLLQDTLRYSKIEESNICFF